MLFFNKCLYFLFIPAHMFCFIEHDVTGKSHDVNKFPESNPQTLRVGAPGWESYFLPICSCLTRSCSLLSSAADEKPRP